MHKRSDFIDTKDGGFIQFQVKISDMKHFLDFAIMHL